MYAEFIMALWEAVCNITYYDDDGRVVTYLTTALRIKYLELYRKSRKYNDHVIEIDEHELEEKKSADHTLDDTLIKDELQRVEKRLSGRKRQIFHLVFFNGYTDRQAASELDISRQYVNRVKKAFIRMVKEEVLDIKENKTEGGTYDHGKEVTSQYTKGNHSDDMCCYRK